MPRERESTTNDKNCFTNREQKKNLLFFVNCPNRYGNAKCKYFTLYDERVEGGIVVEKRYNHYSDEKFMHFNREYREIYSCTPVMSPLMSTHPKGLIRRSNYQLHSNHKTTKHALTILFIHSLLS
jgi:hypothetical protein